MGDQRIAPAVAILLTQDAHDTAVTMEQVALCPDPRPRPGTDALSSCVPSG